MSFRAALAVLPIALLACAAPGRRVAERHRAPRPEPIVSEAPTSAHAPFAPSDPAAIFAWAVGVLDLQGFPVKTCDAERARVDTSWFELLHVRCGATTCLARQSIEVKLGRRVARVVVDREVYDGAARAWRSDPDGAAVAARELVGRIVSAPPLELHGDPCAPAARAEVAALGTARGAR